jgi:hypothetical protein
MIEPVFGRLAEEKGLGDGRQGVAFAKIDIDVGLGRSVAAEWNIRATPTFYFFLDGQKVRSTIKINEFLLLKHTSLFRKLN